MQLTDHILKRLEGSGTVLDALLVLYDYASSSYQLWYDSTTLVAV